MTKKKGDQSLIYQPEEFTEGVELFYNEETLWLTQKQMGELFGKNTDTIGLHIRNVYRTGELEEKGTTEKYSVVQREVSLYGY